MNIEFITVAIIMLLMCYKRILFVSSFNTSACQQHGASPVEKVLLDHETNLTSGYTFIMTTNERFLGTFLPLSKHCCPLFSFTPCFLSFTLILFTQKISIDAWASVGQEILWIWLWWVHHISLKIDSNVQLIAFYYFRWFKFRLDQ